MVTTQALIFCVAMAQYAPPPLKLGFNSNSTYLVRDPRKNLNLALSLMASGPRSINIIDQDLEAKKMGRSESQSLFYISTKKHYKKIYKILPESNVKDPG